MPITTNHLSLTINHLLNMLEKNEMIFGVRAVIEAIQAGREIDKVLVKKDIQSELSKELFTCLKNTLIPVQRVPVERINRITRKNHQGVVAFISSVNGDIWVYE